MQLALTMDWMVDNDLIYAQQLGVTHIMAPVSRWDPAALKGGAHRVRISGMQMAGVDGLPANLLDRIRQRQALDRLARVVPWLGDAGIPVLSLGWGPRRRWSSIEPAARGGALSRQYDWRGGRATGSTSTSSTQESWDALAHALEALLPIAEASACGWPSSRMILAPLPPTARAF